MIIGLFGGGVVGGGFYELLQKLQSPAAAGGLVIKTICVQNLQKSRDFQINSETTRLVTDPNEILSDPAIECVVEVIGGVTLAKEIVFQAIKANKHVVTANKALLATYLTEIIDLLRQHPTVRFGYEAAVCGGIPIIHTLQTTYSGDTISEIKGIMNGTTNFILTKMEKEGADYHDVLREAQMLGYAEADPTADVEGYDVQAKICLLAKLAFGTTLPLSSIPTQGISSITTIDFEFAKQHSWTIKLLGVASLHPSRGLSVSANPTLVPATSLIGQTSGPNNIVLIGSENLADSAFIGPGAGRYPTANSVLADVLRIAQNQVFFAHFAHITPVAQCPQPFPKSSDLAMSPDYEACFYIRFTLSDPGVNPEADAHILFDEKLMKVSLSLAAEMNLPLRSIEKNSIYRSVFIQTTSVSVSLVQNYCERVVHLSHRPEVDHLSLITLPILT